MVNPFESYVSAQAVAVDPKRAGVRIRKRVVVLPSGVFNLFVLLLMTTLALLCFETFLRFYRGQ